jgi:hypothetical protein
MIYRLIGHAVENLVTVTPETLHADIGFGCPRRRKRMRCNLTDSFTNCAQDVVRAGRASIVQELENAFKVRKRAFAIADFHASP